MRALLLLALAVALAVPTGSGRAPRIPAGRRRSPSPSCRPSRRPRSPDAGARSWPSSRRTWASGSSPRTATDYRGTIEALKFKKAEIGWLGPKAYIEASTNNYANVEPVAQVRNQNGSLGYRSCLITHSDSDVFTPEDLAGKTFAFNDPNSTSGYLVPMTFFLNELGVDAKKHFSKVTFSGSHEASILAVANKKVDVASTNLPDMQQLTREGKVTRGGLRVIWVSKLIPNDPVVVRKDLPPSLKTAIEESLVSMKERVPDAFANAGRVLRRRLRPRRRREVPDRAGDERGGQEAGRPEVAASPRARMARGVAAVFQGPGRPSELVEYPLRAARTRRGAGARAPRDRVRLGRPRVDGPPAAPDAGHPRARDRRA